MPSRGQSVTISYTAWDTSANAPKTGDVANHTLRWIKDGTPAAPTNGPAEVDPTNAPGEYKVVLTAAECTCDFGKLAGKSSTANIVIIPVGLAFEQLPVPAAAASGGLLTVGVGTGQLTPVGGNVTINNGVTLDTGAIVSATSTSFVVSGLGGTAGQYLNRRLLVTLAAGGHLVTDECNADTVTSGNHTFGFAAGQNKTPAAADVVQVLGA